MRKTCYRAAKRLLDVVLALPAVVLLLLPWAVIACIIKLQSPGPAVYKPKRVGLNGKEFTLYKFRSMRVDSGRIRATTLRGDDRIFPFGRFLRNSKLDETLQLINILKGEMSIIGPRPILPEEYNDFPGKEQYAARFDVTPGLFCTVDVDYRAAAERKLQFEMDTDYAKNITLRGDLKVFFGVIKTVVSGENVYKEEEHDK